MQRERQLLDPRVRCQPHLVRALLHPDFLEYGASGRMWNVDATVEALAAEAGFSETATNMVPLLLSQDVVLLTFRTDSVERACLRSSVWVHTEGKGWRRGSTRELPSRRWPTSPKWRSRTPLRSECVCLPADRESTSAVCPAHRTDGSVSLQLSRALACRAGRRPPASSPRRRWPSPRE